MKNKKYLNAGDCVVTVNEERLSRALRNENVKFQLGTIISQEQGEDVSLYARRMYETVTKISFNDGKTYSHSNYERNSYRLLDFIPAKKIDDVCSKEMDCIDREIKELQNKIETLQKNKNNVVENGKNIKFAIYNEVSKNDHVKGLNSLDNKGKLENRNSIREQKEKAIKQATNKDTNIPVKKDKGIER